MDLQAPSVWDDSLHPSVNGCIDEHLTDCFGSQKAPKGENSDVLTAECIDEGLVRVKIGLDDVCPLEKGRFRRGMR